MYRHLVFQVFIMFTLIRCGFGASPKNIIFFIGDGMGFEQVKAAGMYANGNPGTLCFESFPYQGEVTTYSANSSVTDSAAAATALATGVKVNDKVVSLAIPGDSTELETLLEYAQARGKRVGLVSTTYISHATPACFGAHETSRSNYSQIVNDYLTQTKPNVLFGGAKYIDATDANNVGYRVVTDRAAMQSLDTNSVVYVSGQFGTEIPYEYGGVGDLPTLSEMTEVAIDILDNEPNGFFVMIEGGKIDWAGHDKLLEENIFETIGFANSVHKAIEWAVGRNDTLILVTGDHETGGLLVTANNGQYEFPDVTWTASGHTDANVPVYAWGLNSWLVNESMDNTDFFDLSISDEISVTLVGPADGATVDANGAVLSCEPIPEAVSYQLQFGADPRRMVYLISETDEPPTDVITTFPFDQTWWTITVRTSRGRRIHANAILINAQNVGGQVIANAGTGIQYDCIQDAIDGANTGEEIIVDPGPWQYFGKIDFKDKRVKLRSTDPKNPAVVASTVINGGHRGPVVTFKSYENSPCEFSGFTITGAGLPDYDLVPMPADMGSRCGAVAFYGLARLGPIVSNCVITGNEGPGIYNYRSSPTIINCTIVDNDGNGVEVYRRSDARFLNCTIAGNRAYGISSSGAKPVVSNCTIVDNYLSGIAAPDFDVDNSIVWGNALADELADQIIDYSGRGSVSYSNVQGGWPGEGNIDAEPLFVEAGYWDANGTAGDVNDDFWVEGDYHLLPASPCIDAGDPNWQVGPSETDLDGNPRVFDGDLDGNIVIDMGAYEFFIPPIEVSMKFTPQSLNPDSHGNWVKAHFTFPEGFDVVDIDVNSPAVLEPSGIEAEYVDVFVNDGFVEVEAGFARRAFCEAGIVDGEVTVTGRLMDGRYFYGVDAIRIIDRRLEEIAVLAMHWLEQCAGPSWCEGSDVNADSVVDFVDFVLLDGCCIEVIID